MAYIILMVFLIGLCLVIGSAPAKPREVQPPAPRILKARCPMQVKGFFGWTTCCGPLTDFAAGSMGGRPAFGIRCLNCGHEEVRVRPDPPPAPPPPPGMRGIAKPARPLALPPAPPAVKFIHHHHCACSQENCGGCSCSHD